MKLSKICQMTVVAAALALATGVGTATAVPSEVYSPVTASDIANPQFYDPAGSTGDVSAEQTAAGAVSWYSSRNGSTAYQGYCEKAARLSWNRSTHHASAIEHWNSSDGAKHTSGAAPKGAFVFWNISSYGHVGISDGNGGIWATSVNGAIGHATSVHYFNNYLGWKPGNSN